MEENKFNQIIKSESFTLVSDIAELSLDSFVNDNIIKDIPIIGTVTKFLNIGNTINDRIFTEKIVRFLKELNSLDQELILKEIAYLDDSKKYNHKVGEKILEIISRIDSDGKPEIIGKLFKNFILKNISYDTFLRLSNIVENIFIYSLLLIKNSTTDNNFLHINLEDEALISSGLCKKRANSNYLYTKKEWESFNLQNSTITKLGETLINNGLK